MDYSKLLFPFPAVNIPQIEEFINDSMIDSCIYIAAKTGQSKIFETILRNEEVRDLEYALYLASENGHLKIVEIIIQKSVDLNIDFNSDDDDDDGNTAFHVACYWGKTGIIEMMINNSESFKHTVVDFF